MNIYGIFLLPVVPYYLKANFEQTTHCDRMSLLVMYDMWEGWGIILDLCPWRQSLWCMPGTGRWRTCVLNTAYIMVASSGNNNKQTSFYPLRGTYSNTLTYFKQYRRLSSVKYECTVSYEFNRTTGNTPQKRELPVRTESFAHTMTIRKIYNQP